MTPTASTTAPPRPAAAATAVLPAVPVTAALPVIDPVDAARRALTAMGHDHAEAVRRRTAGALAQLGVLTALSAARAVGRDGTARVPVGSALDVLPVQVAARHLVESGVQAGGRLIGSSVVVDAERHAAAVQLLVELAADLRGLDAEHERRAEPVRARIRRGEAEALAGGDR